MIDIFYHLSSDSTGSALTPSQASFITLNPLNPVEILIQTSDLTLTGVYNFWIVATFRSIEPLMKVSSAFTVTLVNPCTVNIINVPSPSFTIQAMIGDPPYSVSMPLWTTSMPQCGSIVFAFSSTCAGVTFDSITKTVTVQSYPGITAGNYGFSFTGTVFSGTVTLVQSASATATFKDPGASFITAPIMLPNIEYTVTDPALELTLESYDNNDPSLTVRYKITFVNGSDSNPLIMSSNERTIKI